MRNRRGEWRPSGWRSSVLGHKYLHVCAAPFRRWRRCASSRGAYHCSSDAPCQQRKCATAKTKLFATQHTSDAASAWRRSAAVALLAAAGCSEPFGFVPGGALEGEVAPAPTDWSDLAGRHNIQLELRPDNPYSINMWAVGIGPHVYVATREDGTRWTEYLEETPGVRVRVDEAIYELVAVRVHDEPEHQTVSTAFATKYDLDAEDNWVASGQVFRLDRRTTGQPP